jgi:hypothetical protein
MLVCPVWQYTEEGDTTQVEHGRGSGFSPDVLSTLLGKLIPDPSSTDLAPLLGCAPVCSDQPMRMRLLRELPTLDDIGIAVQKKGNVS